MAGEHAAAQGGQITQGGQTRYARIEAVRGLCALGVATAHVWGFSHNWAPDLVYGEFWRRGMMVGAILAVPVFFALSGYLLYLPFARRDFLGGDRVDLRHYGLNRVRRIFPLYYASTILLLLFVEGGGTLQEWWRFLLFAENWSQETHGEVNGALWSVAVDVHFYLLLPFLAVGIAAVARGDLRRAAVLLALGLAGGIAASRWGIGNLGQPDNELWQHNLPVCFAHLAAGMLVAVARVALERRGVAQLTWRFAWADLALLATIPFAAIAVNRLDWHIVSAICAGLVVAALGLPLRSGVLMRLLDWRPLAVLGLVTYSIYIWQGPVIRAFDDVSWRPDGYAGLLAVSIPMILAAAAVSYLVIERPFLRRRSTWADTAAAPARATSG